MKRAEEWGFVYFAESPDGRYVKFGFTSNPARRIQEICTKAHRFGIPTMNLLGYFPAQQKRETEIRERFACLQIPRGEFKPGLGGYFVDWLYSAPRLRDFMEKTAAERRWRSASEMIDTAVDSDGNSDGATLTSMVASNDKGLQNLYSSVRSRPAPPTQNTDNKRYPAIRAGLSALIAKAPTTGQNGEGTAKRGAPSEFPSDLGRFSVRPPKTLGVGR